MNYADAALKFGSLDGTVSDRDCTCGHRHSIQRKRWLLAVCIHCPCRTFERRGAS